MCVLDPWKTPSLFGVYRSEDQTTSGLLHSSISRYLSYELTCYCSAMDEEQQLRRRKTLPINEARASASHSDLQSSPLDLSLPGRKRTQQSDDSDTSGLKVSDSLILYDAKHSQTIRTKNPPCNCQLYTESVTFDILQSAKKLKHARVIGSSAVTAPAGTAEAMEISSNPQASVSNEQYDEQHNDAQSSGAAQQVISYIIRQLCNISQ